MRPDPASRFAFVVIAAAAAVAGVALGAGGLAIDGVTPALLVLAAFLVAAEFAPLRVPMQHDDLRVSASSVFAVSILLVDGPAAAAIVYCAASVLRDATRGLPAIKVGFNAANVVLATCAAGWVLEALAPQGVLAPLAAATTLWAVNHLLTAVVASLAMPASLRRTLYDARHGTAMDALMLAFAPVVVHIAESHWPELFLLLIPLGALVHSARELDRRRHGSLHDPLTGLPNRLMLSRQIEQEVARARRGPGACAVLLLDLDGFKEVNDTLGHGHGDALLRTLGARLPGLVRAEDTVARLGGDEFGVLLTGPVDAADAVGVTERLRTGLAAPIPVGGLRIAAAASVGIALSEAGDDPERLLRRADVAMYRAKEHRTGFELYDAADDPNTSERLRLAGELRDGIGRDELVLHFQPKVAAADGTLDGVEALVRWQHPVRGLLGPGEFLPLAEQSDLIHPLTLWVIEESLRQVAAWRGLGLELHVAVNLSAHTLRDGAFTEVVEDALRRHDVPADRLQFELTESSLMRDPQHAAEVLERLSERGVRVAIDDFGTGWSSLVWLKRLPVRSIKVDRSFVGDMLESDSDAAIVESTIRLGQTLGLEVVAEGVETEAVLERLRAYGCHTVQGYLIARPQPADELTPWLLAAADTVAGSCRASSRSPATV